MKKIILLLLFVVPLTIQAQTNVFHAEKLIFETKGVNDKYFTTTHECDIKIEISDTQIAIKKDVNSYWAVVNKQQVGNTIMYLVYDKDNTSKRVVFVRYSNQIILLDDQITLTYISKVN
ncbi:MAG: hypothetical protein SNI58_08680 [Rikenellaceae bacterium]